MGTGHPLDNTLRLQAEMHPIYLIKRDNLFER
jgi:hypothetical protein